MSGTIVFGASGQLGQALQFVAKDKTGITFLTEGSANILDRENLRTIFETYSPVYCINCAAYTAVDKAEDEPEVSRKVNRDGVENLAVLCKEFNTVLIHISTDFVFAGTGNQPLSEEEETKPENVYGLTKLEGEQVIQEVLDKYFILRTSWLYSEFGNNFAKTMLRLAAERDELKVIWDQVGTPTYAVDLASCILKIIESGNSAYGIYHFSNQGLTSWYDFAVAIFELSEKTVKVLPVRTSEYVTKAVRPAYTVLDKTKIKTALEIDIPHWRDSLKVCLSKL
jgi:dTDP-4-dehydrorhamnose reductase